MNSANIIVNTLSKLVFSASSVAYRLLSPFTVLIVFDRLYAHQMQMHDTNRLTIARAASLRSLTNVVRLINCTHERRDRVHLSSRVFRLLCRESVTVCLTTSLFVQTLLSIPPTTQNISLSLLAILSSYGIQYSTEQF